MSAYDSTFYDVIRAGIRSSAAALVPVLNDLFHPASVIDVGCGEGHWGATFAALGVAATGVDGDYVANREPGITFIPADLSYLLDVDGPFDLAISLEVAEHLPPERAPSFVDDLCSLAPVVVFSAAIPGQGGTGHLNEQWPGYWAELFREAGYSLSGDDLRLAIWADDRIECWYRQNLLIFEPNDGIRRYREPLALVHPILYDARRGAS